MKKSLKTKVGFVMGLILLVLVVFSIIISYSFYSEVLKRTGIDAVNSMQTQYFIIFSCAELIVALLLLVFMIYLCEIFICKPLVSLSSLVSSVAYSDSATEDKLSLEEANKRMKELNINTGDEIEDMYRSLQKMQMDINEYIIGMREQDWESEHDSMTMLYNKSKYEKRKKDVYPYLDSIYIACVDVINLRIVNERLSPKAGDSIISKVARELRRFSSDTIHTYRLEDDNFLIVMCGYQEEEAIGMLTKWNERVGRLNRVTDSFDCRLVWGGSFGENDFNVDEVFKRADAEMYCQKAIVKKEIGV